MAITLLSSSNNASSAAQSNGSADTKTIVASGNFGGGTLTLEYSNDNSTWVSSGKTLSAGGAVEFNDRPGLHWRVTLAGATSGSVTAVAF